MTWQLTAIICAIAVPSILGFWLYLSAVTILATFRPGKPTNTTDND